MLFFSFLEHPYLAGGLLDESLVRDLEGAKQRLGRVLTEHLLAHEVDVEMVGSIDGGVHAPVAVEHGKEGLLFLVLRSHTRSKVNWDTARGD